MWITIAKFAGFGFFWFVMIFMAILFSTGQDATKKTEIINYVTFIGVPLLGLLIYKIYSIIKHDLSWSTELVNFSLLVIVPLVLAKLFVMFGDRF